MRRGAVILAALGLSLCLAAPLYAQKKKKPLLGEDVKNNLRKRLKEVKDLLERTGRKIKSPLVRQSLKQDRLRLWSLLRRHNRLRCDPTSGVSELESKTKAALKGGQPFHQAGIHRLWYESKLDGRLHPFVVALPRGFKNKRQYPLVVMLHGAGSSPMVAMGRLLGVEDERLLKGEERCNRPHVPLDRAAAIIVAPNAFRNARYRGAGGVDVRAVVEIVKRQYPVDPDRVTVTGLSLGGTGAMETALRNPGDYAAVVALCGYFDRWLDRSTRKKKKTPHELHMMGLLSATHWAENGRYLPLVLIHGTRDGLKRALSMQRAYKKFGYKVRLETYPVGHDVWTPGYKDGRVLARLVKHTRVKSPGLVTFTTGRPRIKKSHWVTIERFADHGKWARVKAKLAPPDQVEVETTNIIGLKLELPDSVWSKKQVRLTLDRRRITVPASRATNGTVTLWREGTTSAWKLGARPAEKGLVKKEGLSGPMDDIYSDPIVVVYGTGGDHPDKLKEIAVSRQRLNKYTSMKYPMVSDKRFLKEVKGGYQRSRYRDHALILVGNVKTNSVLATMKSLPIRVTDIEVRLGKRAFRSPNVGARFIYPNPHNPDHYVMVIAGTTAESYKLSGVLPSYLPDYVVFDDEIGKKPYSPVIGEHRKLVAQGTFGERWQKLIPVKEMP